MSAFQAPTGGSPTRPGADARAHVSGASARAVSVDPDEAAGVLGQMAALLGLAFGLMAFAVEPLLFGAVGVTLGLVGKHTGTTLGRLTVAVAMLAMILGPTFGPVVHAAIFLT